MKALEEKINELEKKLEEKKTAEAESDFARDKRNIKEEAAKGRQVDIDVLHERLVLLERQNDINLKPCPLTQI